MSRRKIFEQLEVLVTHEESTIEDRAYRLNSPDNWAENTQLLLKSKPTSANWGARFNNQSCIDVTLHM